MSEKRQEEWQQKGKVYCSTCKSDWGKEWVKCQRCGGSPKKF